MTDERIEKLARAVAVVMFGHEDLPGGARYWISQGKPWAERALAAIDADPEAYGYRKIPAMPLPDPVPDPLRGRIETWRPT